MSVPERPSYAFMAKALQEQANDSTASEPEHRMEFINEMNKQCAEERQGLYLRFSLPAPARCRSIEHPWTEQEATRCLVESKLSRDVTTLPEDGVVILLWIFARNCGGQLPEVEFGSGVPDSEKHPAMWTFDMENGSYKLIPSEFLELVPTSLNKVRFLRNEKKTHEKSSDGSKHHGGRNVVDLKDSQVDKQGIESKKS